MIPRRARVSTYDFAQFPERSVNLRFCAETVERAISFPVSEEVEVTPVVVTVPVEVTVPEEVVLPDTVIGVEKKDDPPPPALQPPPEETGATQLFPERLYPELQVMTQVVVFTLPFVTEAGLQGNENCSPVESPAVSIEPVVSLAKTPETPKAAIKNAKKIRFMGIWDYSEG
jgi:hypothetical protein